MKKFMILFIGAFMLVGCSNNDGQDVNEDTELKANQDIPNSSQSYVEEITAKSDEISKLLEKINKKGLKGFDNNIKAIEKELNEIKKLPIPSEYQEIGNEFKKDLTEFEGIFNQLKNETNNDAIKESSGLLTGFFARAKELIYELK